MVPAHLMILDVMPLNTSGKIDRKALPAPDFLMQEKYVSPASFYEKKLQQIWSESLQVDNIGIAHNFFDIGGNSLQAIRIVSKIKENLNISLEPLHIMEYPNIRGLARYIAEISSPNTESPDSVSEHPEIRRQNFFSTSKQTQRKE